LASHFTRQLIAPALLLAIMAPLAAAAHSRSDEVACTSDVMRLCKAAIPHETRIVACLEKNKRQLSQACARVFDRPDATPATPVRSEPQPHRWGGQ
jgi:hypothetical protein